MKTTPSTEPWYAQGDPWVLSQNEWTSDDTIYRETIFTQSNGYMGVRGYTEEGGAGTDTIREGYLGGVFAHVDAAAGKQVKIVPEWPLLTMISLPEIFGCIIELDGETFSMESGRIHGFSRMFDMRNGLLTRLVEWESPRGRRTRLLFRRFLSAAVPHLAMHQITVEARDWSGPATLRFDLDGATPAYFRCGERTLPHLPQAVLEDPRMNAGKSGAGVLTVTTRGTGHTVSIAAETAGGLCTLSKPTSAVLRQTVELELASRTPFAVTRSVAVVSSRDDIDGGNVPSLAAEIASEAVRSGFDVTLAESVGVWEHLWAMSDVVIDGPARDQANLRYATFSMLQMAPFHTANMSIPARAYAYNRYHGLYYWDSETFLLPQYLHTHPQAAEHLLSFRHRTLDGARRNAKHLGGPGAAFPWMTDSDEGCEQGPWGIGDYLWHQNADIAYAIDQYVRATGNTRFMLEKGLEVLIETARFWMSRIEEDEDGVVHLHDTVGPDELDKHGRDNGYTSLMARRHLRLAASWIGRIAEAFPKEGAQLVEKLEAGAREIAAWRHAADKLAVPSVPGCDFPLQDEFLLAKKPLSFDGLTADEAFAMRHTHRVVKQADIILAMYLLQDEFTADQMAGAYEFYEPMCLHFSSLSYNTHSIIASKIGRDAQAYDYFLKAAGLDLDNLRGATKDGLHAAALGGTWQTVVYGFLGMKLLDDAISFEPRLPAAWRSIRLRIVYRGYVLNLELGHDVRRITVEGAEGRDAVHLILDGEAHQLVDGLVVSDRTVAAR
jgi:trehalose/maltose hydrolase-like predicted phosphorylase